MSINNNFSLLTRAVNHLNNPNKKLATLSEEVTADIGRSYAGYKRGGIIEGAEKFRKELMSAIVWLFGIPVFKKMGDVFCEKVLNIPMAIDYSFKKEGVDAIENSVKYLTGNLKETNLDVSELKKYGKKFNGKDVQSLIGKVRHAKQATAIMAWIINCALMGIVLPKYNQYLTNKKLEKEQAKARSVHFYSIDDYINNTKKKDNSPSFTGLGEKIGSTISKFVYGIENNNTLRLVSTDVPMIVGRVATSRNKFEGLEYIVMDGGSIFFYNFCNPVVQKFLRSATKTADIDPKLCDIIANSNRENLACAIEKAKKCSNLNLNTLQEEGKTVLEVLFNNKELADLLYKEGTYGKYGKINAFVKNKDLENIALNIVDFLQKAPEKVLDNKGQFNLEEFKKYSNSVCKKSAFYLGAGLITSIIGLSVIMPKLTFWITKLITGKNEFTGLANYDSNKKDVKKY